MSGLRRLLCIARGVAASMVLWCTATGCAPAPADLSLAPADGWILDGLADDPFPAHRAASKRLCPDGLQIEDGVLEIETGDCAYVSASQLTRVALEPGDSISLLLWHGALASTDPEASAHVALMLDDRVLWELDQPIPAAAAVHDLTLPTDQGAPVGSRLVLHLHNHGANAWRVAGIEAAPGELTAP